MFYSRLIRLSSRVIGNRRIPHSQSSYEATYNWVPSAALLAGVGLASIGQVWCEDLSQDVTACREDELTEGVLKKIQIGENSENYIVIAKINGTIYAVGGKCSHYSLPLNNGFLDGFSIICPFHGAAFDIRTGEMVGAPSVQSIPSYEVRVSNGNVVVKIPDSKVSEVSKSVNSRRMVKRDPQNNTSFVIIGGGAAGEMAAETLRKEGFTGKITILSKDATLPYDRVPLSKNFKADAASHLLRDQAFYDEFGIEVRTNTTVEHICTKSKTIRLAGGEQVTYDKALIASGSTAKVPGPYRRAAANIEGIYTIRSAADHGKLKSAISKAKDVVIFGSSFLGLETATAIKRMNPETNVTVIDPDDQPLERVFGHEIARQVLATHRNNGVHFILGQSARAINNVEGRVSGVTYMHTKTIESKPEEREVKADLVLLATGADIQTSFAPPALLNTDGSVRVNSHLQTLDTNVYAAGDVASFYSFLTEGTERIDHWQVAQEQGRVAALNMLCKGTHYTSAPFFWTNQFLNIQFAGFSNNYDWTHTQVRYEGDASKDARITFFFKNNRCIGAAAVNWPGAVIRLRVALERGLMPTKEELSSGTATYETIAERVKQSNPCGGCAQKKCCSRK